MKFSHILIGAAIAVSAMGIFSCSGSDKAESTDAKADTLTVESFMETASDLEGDTVTIAGFCSHLCQHGATKAFLQSADSTQTLLCMATEELGGAFAPDCMGQNIVITGVVAANKISKAELDEYASKLAAEAEAGHCDTESKAFGDLTNWQKQMEDQIAAGGNDTIVVGYYINALSQSYKD